MNANDLLIKNRTVGARHSPPLSLTPLQYAVPEGGAISIGQRMRDWKTLAGFAVSAAIAAFFILNLHLDLGTVLANIRSADVRYLALGLLVYFGAFLFRGLRWRFL